jgi:hypothetical protein
MRVGGAADPEGVSKAGGVDAARLDGLAPCGEGAVVLEVGH